MLLFKVHRQSRGSAAFLLLHGFYGTFKMLEMGSTVIVVSADEFGR